MAGVKAKGRGPAKVRQPHEPLKNGLHEAFCQNVASGDFETLTDAYRAAYGHTDNRKSFQVSASNLSRKYAGRISHLKQINADARRAEATDDLAQHTLADLYTRCLHVLRRSCEIFDSIGEAEKASQTRRRLGTVIGRELRAKPVAAPKRVTGAIDLESALRRLINVEECSCPYPPQC